MKIPPKFVSSEELRYTRDWLREAEIYHTIGTHTINVPSTKTSYVNQEVCQYWPNLQNQNERMTPGQAARTELLREYPLIKKVGWRGPMIKLLDKRVPLLYTGPSKGDQYIYVDLDGAYWQIYRRLWLDTSWPGGYYGNYPLVHVADRLKKWKAARNALIGISRMRTITGVRGRQRTTLHVKNKFLSPPLWATVIDCLHWVAQIAIACECIYIHTDGYMFNKPDMADNFMIVLASLGFLFSVRTSGPGDVRGWCVYKIGEKSTKPYLLGLNHTEKEFTNVQQEQTVEWSRYWRNLGNIVLSGRLHRPRNKARR